MLWSLLARYGQTGSGKSYTMMGSEDGSGPGLIPRLCQDLFDRIHAKTDTAWTAHVEVSFMEIYLEKVRDLLHPNPDHKLRVREHQSTVWYLFFCFSTLSISLDYFLFLTDFNVWC